VDRLAVETPAAYVAFDLLAMHGESLLATPFGDRRRRLTRLLANATAPLFVTPATDDPAVAADWFDRFEGAGLDGVMAKPLAAPYAPDKRTLFKIKHARTADAVVAGYRQHKSGDGIGSLLLGLHDADGRLHFVGVASSFTAARRRELTDLLAPLRIELDDHPWREWAGGADTGVAGSRTPGAPSRWNAGKNLDWVPLRPQLVAEVGYDHLQGDRFRHTTRLLRFRPDREPASCTYAQLERPLSFALGDVLAAD
jgi:ATP-dependent DNA ligase